MTVILHPSSLDGASPHRNANPNPVSMPTLNATDIRHWCFVILSSFNLRHSSFLN